MEGFTMTDLQALSINRDDINNGSFRKKKELVSKKFHIRIEDENILFFGI